ncbi:hypothetical protein ABZP36_008857 [Zizania latifolia]
MQCACLDLFEIEFDGIGAIGKINYQEYLKLKTRVEFLQTTQRNILGEDLGPVSMKELEQLENQIEVSLKQIRSRSYKKPVQRMCCKCPGKMVVGTTAASSLLSLITRGFFNLQMVTTPCRLGIITTTIIRPICTS